MDRSNKRPRILHAGVAIGAGGLILAIILGIAANARASGLGVAAALASNSLHLRAIVILYYGCVALLLSMMWTRLVCDTPAFTQLRSHVKLALTLCAAGPLLLLAVNHGIVTGLITNHLALLPPLVAVAIAVLYAIVSRRLSGITGVGLGTRLMLRGSYVWLLATALLHLSWTLSRVIGGQPDLLWFVERPTIEMGLIGFAIAAALGVLLTNLTSVYHSREMTQTLMRTHQITNGLTVLWGLSLMWSLRYPGGPQGLASSVIGIALMILLAIIAGSSGLLNRNNLIWLGEGRAPRGGDGVWAGRIASIAMLLVLITAALIGTSGIVLAGLGEHPPHGLLAALVMSVGLGVVPLSIAAALAPALLRREATLVAGAAMIAVGGVFAVLLWSFDALVTRSLARQTVGAEITTAVGLLLIGLAARKICLFRR